VNLLLQKTCDETFALSIELLIIVESATNSRISLTAVSKRFPVQEKLVTADNSAIGYMSRQSVWMI